MRLGTIPTCLDTITSHASQKTVAAEEKCKHHEQLGMIQSDESLEWAKQECLSKADGMCMRVFSEPSFYPLVLRDASAPLSSGAGRSVTQSNAGDQMHRSSD
jgi:hypothetical protein